MCNNGWFQSNNRFSSDKGLRNFWVNLNKPLWQAVKDRWSRTKGTWYVPSYLPQVFCLFYNLIRCLNIKHLKIFSKNRAMTRVFNNKRVVTVSWSLWGYCNNIHICSCISLTLITCLSIWDKIILQSLKKACLIILDKRIFLLDKILLKPGFH